ncbi:MAG: Cna B-type domain-containing protein [Clostridia bacterium]|nr:Cna B-type domain-containing protein [Clostridia bacterium]
MTESDVRVEQTAQTVEDLISGGALTEEQAVALGLVSQDEESWEFTGTKGAEATRDAKGTRGLMNAKAPESAKAVPAATMTETVVLDIQLANDAVKTEDGQYQVPVRLSAPIRLVEAGFAIQSCSVQVYHIADGKATAVPVWDVAVKNGRLVSFVIETDGFSPYVVKYTVDFVFNGIQFSMPGGGALLLSELFDALNIDADATQIASVAFTNPAVLTVEPCGDEWRMYSHCAFTTAETLTVTMTDGTVYEISVTDAISYEMADALSVATINGQSGGSITLRPDELNTIHLEFSEVPGSIQFPTTENTLTYQLPAGFVPGAALTGVPVVLRYTEDNLSHTLTDCTYDLSATGLLTVHLSDIAQEKLATSGDGVFKVDITALYTGTGGHVDFNGSHSFDITVDNSSSVAVNKYGAYDSAANKVRYTVNVDSTGTNHDVVVTDSITGNALTLDGGSFVIRDASGNERTDITLVVSGNGFTLNIPTMANKERLTVEYTASVNWDVIGNGKGTVEQTGNTVTVKSDEDPNNDPVTHDLENRISYNPLAKSAGTVIGEETADTKIVPWTISLNAQQLKNMAGTTITDTIDNGSQSIMSYTGDGVTLTIKNGNDVVDTQTLFWASLGIDPATAKSWQYTIPDNGQPNHYQYIFTYNTIVDVSAQNGNTYVSNRVGDQDWNSAGGWQEVHPGSGVIGVEKENTAVSETEMSWTVTLDVPAGGLGKAVVTDYFPTLNWGSEQFQDTLKADSIRIEGLQQGVENYTVRTTDDKYVITFYKDQFKTATGLNASGTGERRTITITFTTTNDHAWVSLHRDLDHTNYVTFEGDNSIVTAQDTGRVPDTGMKKTGRIVGTATNSDNVKVVIFEYTIDLYGVEFANDNDCITVTDTYDAPLTFFDLHNDGLNALEGMNSYWGQKVQNGYRSGSNGLPRIHPDTSNANSLTFTIHGSDVDKDGDGHCLPRYQIIYYMTAPEETLIQASINNSEDRKVSIANTAAWDTSSDSVTIDYSYPALVKNNVPPSSQDEVADAGQRVLYDPATGTTGFEIVINPGKRTLNGGSPMTMTDEFSATLSVDYSSIKVWVDDVEDTGSPRQVTYDYRGSKGTFTIPDGKKVVIRYDAKVIGNPGQWVSYNNTATMNGYTDTTGGSTQVAGSSEAGFNINSIRVYKYAAGDMTQAIGGVTFTLVDASGDPVLYTNSSTTAGHEHVAGQHVTYTTGSDGYVTIKPSEQEDGFSLQKGITYYLKETGTPNEYARNNTIYRFTLSDNPDYAVYEYHSGDIMKIYNWPALGRIDVRKTFEGTSSNLTEEEKRRITFEITGTYPGTNAPVKMDAWGYPIEASAAKDSDAVFKRTFTYADFSVWNGQYVYSMEDLVDGVYTVRETKADLPGYNTVTTTYTVDSDPAAPGTEATVTISSHNSHQVRFTNTYDNKKPGVDIVIKKINKTGNVITNLYGAKFKLEKWDASANAGAGAFVTCTEGSVGSDGTFTIAYSNRDTGVTLTSLEVGRYRITEVQAPNNYKIAENGDGKFVFDVTESGGSLSVSYTADTDVDSFDQSSNTFSVNNEVKHSYNITKVDGANVSLKLAGAEFGVYQHVTRNSEDQDRTAAKEGALPLLYTYKTNIDGQFEIQFSDVLNGGAHYSDAQDVTYFIMETKAPKGYSLPYNPKLYYFFFGENNPSDLSDTRALNLAEYTWNRTITNDLIELEVTKQWRDLDNAFMLPDDVDEVEFRLFQTEYVTNRHTLETTVGETHQYPYDSTAAEPIDTIYTISKDAYGNWPTLTIGYLPVVGARNEDEVHTYTYRVEEIEPDGYKVSYSESEDGRHLYMTNTPEGTYLEAVKVWSGNTPNALKKTAFYLQRKPKDGSDSWTRYRTRVTLPHETPEGYNEEAWLATEDAWLARWEDLPKEYIYRVEEVLTDGGMSNDQAIRFEIVESTNNVEGVGEGRVAITNNYQETSIRVEKVWSADTPEAVKAAAYVKVDLLYRAKNDPTDPWKIYPSGDHLVALPRTGEGEEPWAYEWTDLRADYEYTVHEYMDSTTYAPRFNITIIGPDGNETTNPASGDAGGVGYAGGTFTANNTYRSTSVQVQKKWVGDPSESKIIESQVTFQLKYKPKASADDASVAWINYGYPVYVSAYQDGHWVLNTDAYEVLANGDWLFTWDDLPDTNVYKVEESFTYNGSMFTTTYTSEGGNVISEVSGVEGGTIVVTNTYDATWIEAEKIWVGTLPSWYTKQVVFHLWKKNADGTGGWNDCYKAQTLYASDANTHHWVARWDDLETGYIYRVTESGLNSSEKFTSVQSSNNVDGIAQGRVTWTNIYSDSDHTKINVEKLWVDGSGNELASEEVPDSISLDILRAEINDEGKTVQIITTRDYINEWYSWENGESVQHLEPAVETRTKSIIVNAGTSNITVSLNTDRNIAVTGGNSAVSAVDTANKKLTLDTVNSDVTITVELTDGTYNNEVSFDNSSSYEYHPAAPSSGYTRADTVTLYKASGFKTEWTDSNTQSGKIYFYKIDETSVPEGFTLKQYYNNEGIRSGVMYAVNQKDSPTETSVTVTKAWNNADGSTGWPDNAEIQATLYRTVNGEKTAVLETDLTAWISAETANPVTLSGSKQTATWTKLPLKDESENDITYTVEENGVTDGAITVNGVVYDSFAAVSGHTTAITNYERTAVTAEKIWETGIDASQYTVQVRLNQYVDGTINNDFALADRTKTLTSASWTASWSGLSVIDAAGHALTYDVTEIGVFQGETDVTDQFIAVAVATGIKNYAATVDVPVTKVWDLGGEEVPAGATVTAVIYQRERLVVDNGVEAVSPAAWSGDYTATANTVTITGTGSTWTGSATGLPKYRYDSAENDLYEIQYTAREISVTAADGATDLMENYSSSAVADNGAVIITNTPKQGISLNVIKNWQDSGNASGIRPASVTVQLYSSADNFAAPMAGKDIVLNAANNWRGGWTNLDEQYTYKVQELTVGGYTVSYDPADGVYTVTDGKNTDNSTVTVTNSRGTPPTGTIEVKKAWQYSNGETATTDLPENVQIVLNGTENAGSSQQSGTAVNFQVLVGYSGNAEVPANTSLHYQAYPGETVVFNYDISSTNPGINVWTHGNDQWNYWSNSGVTPTVTTEGNIKRLSITVPDNSTGITDIRIQVSGDSNDSNVVQTYAANSSFSGGGNVNSDTNTYPYTLTLNAANGWYATLSGLDPDHNTYTLEEIVPSGAAFVPVSYTLDGTNVQPQNGLVTVAPGTVIVTNRVLDGAVKLKKIVYDNGVADSGAEGDYNFSLQRVDENGQAQGEPIYINLWLAGNIIRDYRVMTSTAYGYGSDYYKANGEGVTYVSGNTDGYAVISNLVPGDYWLKEESNTRHKSALSIQRGDEDSTAVDLENSRVKLHVTAGAASPADSSAAAATFINDNDYGVFKLKKAVTVNGGAPDSSSYEFVDGAYLFTVTRAGESDVLKYVWIIVENGAMTKYAIHTESIYWENPAGWWRDLDADGWAIVDDRDGNLALGDYVVQEQGCGYHYTIDENNNINIDENKPLDGVSFAGVTGGTVSGSATTVTVAASDPDEVTFTNNIENGAIKIKKAVLVNGVASNDSTTNGTYSFTVKGFYPGAVESEEYDVTITMTNGVMTEATVTKGGTTASNADVSNLSTQGVVISELPLGWYDIREESWTLDNTPTAGTGMFLKDITVENGALGGSVLARTALVSNDVSVPTVIFTNDMGDVTSVSVEKRWATGTNVAGWPDGYEVDVVLKAGDASSDEYVDVTTVTLDSDHQTHTFENLRKYDNNGDLIDYTVEEGEVWDDAGNSTEKYTPARFTVGENSFLIINTDSPTWFWVKKYWDDGQGGTGCVAWDGISEITFSVTRRASETKKWSNGIWSSVTGSSSQDQELTFNIQNNSSYGVPNGTTQELSIFAGGGDYYLTPTESGSTTYDAVYTDHRDDPDVGGAWLAYLNGLEKAHIWTDGSDYFAIFYTYKIKEISVKDSGGNIITGYSTSYVNENCGEYLEDGGNGWYIIDEDGFNPITNTRTGALKLTKIVQDSDPVVTLPGAKFQLYKLTTTTADDGQGGTTTIPVETAIGAEQETPANGEITFTNLTNGRYKIVETQAPAGYNMMTSPIFFTITAGAVTWTNEAGTAISYQEKVTYTAARAAVADDPSTPEDETSEATPATFTVGNTPGVELPATGGPGTAMYTVSGLALTLGALWMLLRRKREQN